MIDLEKLCVTSELNPELLNHIVNYRGSPIVGDSKPFFCKIGDSSYLKLVSELEKDKNARLSWTINRIKNSINKQEKKQDLEDGAIAFLNKRVELFESLLDIDYDNFLKNTVDHILRGFPEPKSFQGINCVIGDNHALAYYSIQSILQKTKEPVTLLRFDRHADCDIIGSDVNCTNYVSFLLKEYSSKIKEVITCSYQDLIDLGDYEQLPYDDRFKRNLSQLFLGKKVSSVFADEFLKKIKGPVIIDVDLDCLEKIWAENNLERHVPGGMVLLNVEGCSIREANQRNVLVHPYDLALRMRYVTEELPLAVLIHTERSFRNLFFHTRIEYDFLKALYFNSAEDLRS